MIPKGGGVMDATRPVKTDTDGVPAADLFRPLHDAELRAGNAALAHDLDLDDAVVATRFLALAPHESAPEAVTT
jgi:hypothetical protein